MSQRATAGTIPWWGKKVGWPFLVFVMMAGIGVCSALLFWGYQDLFALRERSVETTQQRNGETIAPGEGIVVTFNEPILTDTLSAAVYPATKIRLSTEEGMTHEDARKVRIIPEQLPRPGNAVVVVLSGLTSVFGTELPERRYAFPTRPLPTIKSIRCAEGIDLCKAGDAIQVEWVGDRSGFAAAYVTQSGQPIRGEEITPGTDLLHLPEMTGETKTITIRLFESADGAIVGKEAVLEEQYQIRSTP